MTDEEGMQRAIAVCRTGIALGHAPFGAVIIRGDEILSERHNSVRQDHDPTAHAEINALRSACGTRLTRELSGATLYSTCEPCPMCLAAIHWARVDRLVFGATIQDAEEAGLFQIPLPAPELASRMASPMRIQSRVLHDACVELFQEWKRHAAVKPS